MNDFLIYASWDSYLETSRLSLTAGTGVTQGWLQSGCDNAVYHKYNQVVGQFTVTNGTNLVTLQCSGSPNTSSHLWIFVVRTPIWDFNGLRRLKALKEGKESKDSKESTQPVVMTRSSGYQAPPPSPTSSSSQSSSTSSGVISSGSTKGWF